MTTANLSLIKKTLHTLHRIEDCILIFLLGSMLVLAASQIIMREVLNSGVAWIDPLLRIAVLWLGLFGALLATRGNRHIEIDLFTHMPTGRIKTTVHTLTSIFAATVCGTIAYHAARFVLDEIEYSSPAFAGLPAWPFETVIPLTFGLMTVRFLIISADRIKRLIGWSRAHG